MKFNIKDMHSKNVATTPHMAQKGLKDGRYNSMYFPRNGQDKMQMTMQGMKDPVFYQGLSDNGKVIDQGIAYPGQNFTVKGNVFEQRIKSQNGMRFNTKNIRIQAQNGLDYNTGDPRVQEQIQAEINALNNQPQILPWNNYTGKPDAYGTGMANTSAWTHPDAQNQLDMNMISNVGVAGVQGGAAALASQFDANGNPINPDGTPSNRNVGPPVVAPNTVTRPDVTNTGAGSPQAGHTVSSNVVAPNNSLNTNVTSSPQNTPPHIVNANGPVGSSTAAYSASANPAAQHKPVYDPNKKIIGWKWTNPDGTSNEEMLSKKDQRRLNRRGNGNGIGNEIDKMFAHDPRTYDERDRIAEARAGIKDANKDFRVGKKERNLNRRAANLEQILMNKQNRNQVSDPALNSRMNNQIYNNSMQNTRVNKATQSKWQKKYDRELAKANRNVNLQEALNRVQNVTLPNNEQEVRLNQRDLTKKQTKAIKKAERILTNRQEHRANFLNRRQHGADGGVFYDNEPFNVAKIPSTGRILGQYGINTGDNTFNINDQEIQNIGSNNYGFNQPTAPTHPGVTPTTSTLQPLNYQGPLEDYGDQVNNEPELSPIYGNSTQQSPKQHAQRSNTGAKTRMGQAWDNLSTGAKVQLFGEALPAAYNLGLSMEKPEFYNRRTNEGLQKGLQTLRSTDTRVDRQNMQAQHVALQQSLNNQTGSEGSRQANKLKAYNNMMQQERGASKQEAQNKMALSRQIADQQARIGADNLRATTTQLKENESAVLQRDMLRNKAVTQHGQLFIDAGRQMDSAAENKFEVDLMSQMYSKYAPMSYEKIASGQYNREDLIQFKNELVKNGMSEEEAQAEHDKAAARLQANNYDPRYSRRGNSTQRHNAVQANTQNMSTPGMSASQTNLPQPQPGVNGSPDGNGNFVYNNGTIVKL